MRLFENATCLRDDAEMIARRSYGVIEIEDERLRRIRFRPWPKIITLLEVWTIGDRFHRRAGGNRCWLFFNQPRSHRNFLSLKYAISTAETTYKTARASLIVLDEVARIKGCDAILGHVTNDRLTPRFLERIGYERHLTKSKQRHYIRRFYGNYPEPDRAYGLM